MIAPILAATLTLQMILTGAEDFSRRAGLDVPPLITTNMVTKFKLHPEDQDGFAIVSNIFHFTWLRGVICNYIDGRESVNRILTRGDPAQLKQWSEQPSLLDEKSALELARDYFHKLGFKDEDFDPPECHQYTWSPSFERQNEINNLPAFEVEWLKKGYKKIETDPLNPMVKMIVSGATKRMVYFNSGSWLWFKRKYKN